MKTVHNNTRGPIAVPLPGGRKLHLGPGKSGQISPQAVEHPPLAALVTSGALEIGEVAPPTSGPAPGGGRPVAVSSSGHHPATKGGRRGDR